MACTSKSNSRSNIERLSFAQAIDMDLGHRGGNDEECLPGYTFEAPPPYASREPDEWSRQPTTRSSPFSPGVVFEWDYEAPARPDDIIIVTVRVKPTNAQESVDTPKATRSKRRCLGCFMKRLSDRMTCRSPNCTGIRAIKMPRREYVRYHKRDREGNYIGTEPEREWSDEVIEEMYGRYQKIPLTRIGSRMPLQVA